MNAADQARIRELEQRISSLKQKNKKLQNELDQCNKVKQSVHNLMEDHFAHRKQDASRLSGADIKPSRSVSSFLRELESSVQKGASKTISGNFSGFEEHLAKKRNQLDRVINSNNNEIRTCDKKIRQIREHAAMVAAQALTED